MFGKGVGTMHCTVVDVAVHREVRQLVGHDMELALWQTDPRIPPLTLDREYDPDELGASEQWIVDLFEPVRKVLGPRPPRSGRRDLPRCCVL